MESNIVKKDEWATQVIGQDNPWTTQQIVTIRKQVAKNTNDSEFAYFLNVAKSLELNPFNKEIWCYKDNKNNLLIFAGRDGFLKKAQENPRFAGIRSCEICEKDDFSIDVANNKIHHKITGFGAERGRIKGAYAIVFVKGGEPTIELADFQTYNKGRFTWSTHPAEMIKKVAETHALKKAMGITGIISEHDYDIRNNVAVPMSLNAPKSIMEEVEILRRDIDSGMTDQEWIERVCQTEIQRNMPATAGEKDHIFQVMKEYDLDTAEKIPNNI